MDGRIGVESALRRRPSPVIPPPPTRAPAAEGVVGALPNPSLLINHNAGANGGDREVAIGPPDVPHRRTPTPRGTRQLWCQ